MHVLVTAGNTQAPIDRVRCITNIFTGRTGASVALRAWERGNTVTLLTSHPEAVANLQPGPPPATRWTLHPYRTFDDLRGLMAGDIPGGAFDVIVHSAAVSDYLGGGIYHVEAETAYDPVTGRWTVQTTPALTAGKVKS